MVVDPEPEKLWSIEKPQLPKRSRLYHLPPVGVGTPFVESLTSYIARLAESHRVFPGVLMERELLPFVRAASNSIDLEQPPSRTGIFSRTGTLNSIGVMAVDWVRALETLTLRSDLRFLTMLTWSEVLPSRGLLRSKKAYCPACYQEWRSCGQVIYEPLLWMINQVKICPRHQCRLRLQCFHCVQSLPPLAWCSRPGYCSKCSGWLGIFLNVQLQNFELVTQEEWHRHAVVVDAIGDLMAAAPRLTSPPKRERIAQVLSACVDELGEGSIAAFARLLKQPRNTVWVWHNGQVLPSLDILLKICDCLEISLMDFLIQDVAVIAQGRIKNLPQIQPLGTPRKLPRALDSNKIQQVLEAVLESDEYPPPSMTKVAQHLEYDVRFLRQHFSDLCHAISARYLREKRNCYNRRIERLCLEVREVALKLNAQGVYPSNTRVSSYLKQPGCIRNKDVRAALYAVRRQLGWKA